MFVPISKVRKGFGKAFVGAATLTAWRSRSRTCTKICHFKFFLFLRPKVGKTHVAAFGKFPTAGSGLAVPSGPSSWGRGIRRSLAVAGSTTSCSGRFGGIAAAIAGSIEIVVARNHAAAGSSFGFWNGRGFLLFQRVLVHLFLFDHRGWAASWNRRGRRFGGGIHDQIAIRRLGATVLRLATGFVGFFSPQFPGVQHKIKGRTGLAHVSFGTVLLGPPFVGRRVEVKVRHAHGERLLCCGRHGDGGCVVELLDINICVRLLMFSR